MKKRRTADDFARRVDALYARALAGKPFDAKNQEREVQAVAFALARIRSLIDCAVKQVGLSALPETALVAAADLLDALMKGTSHPIWRYIREGKSRKRANKSPGELDRQYAPRLRGRHFTIVAERRAAPTIETQCRPKAS